MTEETGMAGGTPPVTPPAESGNVEGGRTEIGAFAAFIIGLGVGLAVMIFYVYWRAGTQESEGIGRAGAAIVGEVRLMGRFAKELEKVQYVQALKDLKIYVDGAAASQTTRTRKIEKAVNDALAVDPADEDIKKLKKWVDRELLGVVVATGTPKATPSERP